MLELKNNIFYVGVKDPTLRTFDIFMKTEYGTTYNAYLVKGEKTALIETAHEKLLDSYISNIEEIMPVSEIDYLICNHTEPDHSGSVKKILELNPDVEVVGIEEANWSRAKAGLAASRLLSQNPDINYIGFEMYDSVLLRALQKMEERAENGNTLPNVFFVRMDARELPLIFDAEEVDKIYLNFSDPWPK